MRVRHGVPLFFLGDELETVTHTHKEFVKETGKLTYPYE